MYLISAPDLNETKEKMYEVYLYYVELFSVFPKIFSQNSANLVIETFVINGSEPVTSCIRAQDATTAPARQESQRPLNWPLFMLRRFITTLNSLKSLNISNF